MIGTGANTSITPAEAASLWGTPPAENEAIREFSFGPLQLSITADQVVRRTVVFQLRCCLALEFGNDSLGEHLTQLDTPLVKRIDVPNHALREDAVFVKRDEFARELSA